MVPRLPHPNEEIWFRPRWYRPGRVGAWHLLAAGQTLPNGKAVCGYEQWYKSTGYETTERRNALQGAPQDDDRPCARCVSILKRLSGSQV